MVFTMNMAYQRTRLVDTVGIKRTRDYYRAQAGVVDAAWRLRANVPPPGYTGAAASFTTLTNTFDYYIDIENGSIRRLPAPFPNATPPFRPNVHVQISAVGAAAVPPAPAGLRRITATGHDF